MRSYPVAAGLRGLLVLTLVAASSGCTDDGEDTGVIIADGTDDPGCGETPPSIDQFTVTYQGMSEGDACGDEIHPLIRIETVASDADSDLTYWTLRVWYDDTIDGQVAAEGEYFEVFGTLSDEECDVANATVAMLLCVTGNPPYSTELEFGAVLMDDSDNKSNDGVTVVQVFTTPDADGNF